MKLNDIVRTKFLPPRSQEVNNPYKRAYHDSVSYGIKIWKERFIPWLKLHDSSEELYARPNRDSFGSAYLNESVEFSTAEGATEFCWENFEKHYKDDMVSRSEFA